MNFPENLKYTKTHEWLSTNGSIATVGVTEYAQKELSDVVYVELPEIGKEVVAGEAACVIESVKAAFDIYAPLSGKVVEVNDTLEGDPALVNSSCYENGWLFKVEISNASEIDALMDAASYTEHVQSTAH